MEVFPKKKRHLKPLTSVRFIAAFHVVVYHSTGFIESTFGAALGGIGNLLHTGYTGVNLFFVLWLGPPLERVLGSGRFVAFYASAGVFSYAFYVLGAGAGLVPNWGPTAGASGCVLAVAALYALRWCDA